jgi:hypothetical protein
MVQLANRERKTRERNVRKEWSDNLLSLRRNSFINHGSVVSKNVVSFHY